MVILRIWRHVLEQSGLPGVLALALYVALAVGALLGVAWSLGAAALRALHRWQLRRELQVLRGGRTPIFTMHGDLEDRPSRPPVPSLRRRGGDSDAA